MKVRILALFSSNLPFHRRRRIRSLIFRFPSLPTRGNLSTWAIPKKDASASAFGRSSDRTGEQYYQMQKDNGGQKKSGESGQTGWIIPLPLMETKQALPFSITRTIQTTPLTGM